MSAPRASEMRSPFNASRHASADRVRLYQHELSNDFAGVGGRGVHGGSPLLMEIPRTRTLQMASNSPPNGATVVRRRPPVRADIAHLAAHSLAIPSRFRRSRIRMVLIAYVCPVMQAVR